MSDVIDEAKKVLEGVTSGPWSVESEGTLGAYISAGERHIAIAVDNNGDTANKSNARFIAWAREGVPALLAENAAKDAEIADLTAKLEAVANRKGFPILGQRGVYVDWQLVADHGGQADTNHGQTVARLAERGGLSWCELFAVLHNQRWQKMDANEAMIACRALESRYLAALKGATHE